MDTRPSGPPWTPILLVLILLTTAAAPALAQSPDPVRVEEDREREPDGSCKSTDNGTTCTREHRTERRVVVEPLGVTVAVVNGTRTTTGDHGNASENHWTRERTFVRVHAEGPADASATARVAVEDRTNHEGAPGPDQTTEETVVQVGGAAQAQGSGVGPSASAGAGERTSGDAPGECYVFVPDGPSVTAPCPAGLVADLAGQHVPAPADGLLA